MHNHDDCSLKKHTHLPTQKNAKNTELRLYLTAFALSLFAGLLEITVRYLISGSISLFGDAIHGIADGSTYGLLALVLLVSKNHEEKELPWTIFAVLSSFALLAFGDYLVFVEAWNRFLAPQEVLGWWTFFTATLCFCLNGFVVWMMHKIPKEDHNIRHDSLSFHALSDMWVSVGVIGSSAIIALTGWYSADWIMAFIIAFYLLFLLCVLGIRIVRGNWKIGHEHHRE